MVLIKKFFCSRGSRYAVFLLGLCIVVLLPASATDADGSISSYEYHFYEDDSIVKIDKNWGFMPINTPDPKSLVDQKSKWIVIPPHSTWTDLKELHEYRDYGWYKCIIHLYKTGPYSLIVPIHYRGAQFFINNKKFFESRPFDKNGNTPPVIGKKQSISIPPSFLHPGKNILLIRTGTLNSNGGFTGPIIFGKTSVCSRKFFIDVIWHAVLGGISFFLSLFFLIIYIKRREEPYYLNFSFLAFGLSCWILGFETTILWIFDYQIVYLLFTYCGALLVPVSGIMFLHSFFKTRLNLLAKIILSWFVLLAFMFLVEIAVTGRIEFFQVYLYIPFILSNALIVFYILYYGIAFRWQAKQYSFSILGGILILLFSYVVSMGSFLGLVDIRPVLLEGFFFMTLVFAWVLASRFAQVHTDLESVHGELTILDKMKDEFLATTSHELRTPLHGIIGLTDSMLTGTDKNLSSEHEQDIELIRNSAQRLNGLVDEILDFSKLRAGRADLYLDKVDLKQIIPSVTSIIEGMAGKKSIKIIHDVAADVPVITGDRHRVEQVLLNLLSNAVKFTEAGFITVAAHGADGGVSVAVHDSGIGMNRSELKRIWNPYEQGQESERRTGEGTGLGLAICRHLVELHGGTIDVESEKGKGSIFTIWLPPSPTGMTAGIRRKALERVEKLPQVTLPPDIDIKAAGAPSVPGHEKSGELIMVIDDDQVNLQILERLLVREGYRVKTFQKGSDALASIENELPHLILLDLMLPEMSGYDIMLKVRQHFQHAFIPVIMITARSQVEDMVKGFIFGCNDYLSKPFNQQELLVRVQNQLVMKNFLDSDQKLSSEDFDKESLLQRSRVFRDTINTLKEWESIITRDLDMSKVFLESLMGVKISRDDIDVHVTLDPLLAIGGDLYLVHEPTDDRVRLFIADATGHGINASLNCITIMSEYNLLRDMDLSPAEIIFRLNNRFIQISEEQHIVFTCCIVDIFIERQELEIATAGHPHQVVISPAGELHLCKPRGAIIGLAANVPYENMKVAFVPGSMLGLFSDGLIENYAEVKKDHPAVHDGKFLYETLLDNQGAVTMAEACKKTISTMKGKGRRKRIDDDDDVTLILLKYLGK